MFTTKELGLIHDAVEFFVYHQSFPDELDYQQFTELLLKIEEQLKTP